jgi:hypothetical protein
VQVVAPCSLLFLGRVFKNQDLNYSLFLHNGGPYYLLFHITDQMSTIVSLVCSYQCSCGFGRNNPYHATAHGKASSTWCVKGMFPNFSILAYMVNHKLLWIIIYPQLCF